MTKILVSFSGGETSALMTKRILDIGEYEAVVVFANTGQENEETLEFVKYCDEAYGFGTVWVEAVVHHNDRKANTHRIVNFDTACRDGSVFEETIRKYGIPNSKFPSCTRDLKLYPIKSYMKSIGWKKYYTAIGIRADEPHRRSKNAAASRIVYPLLDDFPTTKPEVNQFWSGEPERLRLLGYQGNCKWCWKKSFRKLMAIMDDDPANFDFPGRMEADYGLVGPEFQKRSVEGYRRTFFRGNVSVEDLKTMYGDGASIFDRGADDSITLPDGSQLSLDLNNDGGSGCSESCEIDFSIEEVGASGGE